MEDHQFIGILSYIWKGRNNKVFSNVDIDQMDTLKLTETKSLLWAEAQVSLTQGLPQNTEVNVYTLPTIQGRWCFTDGSWNDQKCFSGKGWYNTLEGFDGLMRVRNTRTSLSPFTRKWKRSFEKWNVQGIYVSFRLHLQQIVFRH